MVVINMSNKLSERITALRKERGLTQEQLGKMCGVSYQAVGKWEKGGAPDALLLPVVASQLSVTVDSLFGMETATSIDIVHGVNQWLRGFPEKKRMEKLCDLIRENLDAFMFEGFELPRVERMPTARQKIHGTNQLVFTSGRGAEDF